MKDVKYIITHKYLICVIECLLTNILFYELIIFNKFPIPCRMCGLIVLLGFQYLESSPSITEGN